MSNKDIPRWVKVLGYGTCAFNSLLLLLLAVDYIFCEIDLFLVVWMSSILLLVTVPLGLVCFIVSLCHLRQREERLIVIWNVLLVAVLFVVFYLLPSGSSRIPAKMEKHCVQHGADMLALTNQLYDLMPDSTMLEYSSKEGITLSRIDSLKNPLGHPFANTDTTLSLNGDLPNNLQHQLKALHCYKLTLYKPTALATFNYLHSGFATYWFEVLLTPYTPEQVQQQLNDSYTVPFSSHVCFRFHGGATDGDAPFPYKEQYVESLRQRGLI